MIGTYLAILAALLTAQQYQTNGWSAGVMSALFWLLAFGGAAGLRALARYVVAKSGGKGGRA